MSTTLLSRFSDAAQRAGAEVLELESLQQAANHIKARCSGTTLVPQTTLAHKHSLNSILKDHDIGVYEGDFKKAGKVPAAGITFSNFSMADTGTVVLESTMENIRLATTLPEIHFVIVDPATILEDNLAAIQPMTEIHRGSQPRFVAYITGPSRTADIERVLTIGCHGPRELHILLIRDISSDLMEI